MQDHCLATCKRPALILPREQHCLRWHESSSAQKGFSRNNHRFPLQQIRARQILQKAIWNSPERSVVLQLRRLCGAVGTCIHVESKQSTAVSCPSCSASPVCSVLESLRVLMMEGDEDADSDSWLSGNSHHAHWDPALLSGSEDAIYIHRVVF